MHAIGHWEIHSGEDRGREAGRLRTTDLKGLIVAELVVVLAIAILLMGASVAVIGGLHDRAKRLQSEAELAVLRNGLEVFRGVYGDYPLTGDAPTLMNRESLDARMAEVMLFNALLGRLDAGLRPDSRKRHLDWQSLVTARAGVGVDPVGSDLVINAFVDPWGNPYVYRYRASAGEVWRAATCLIYSRGPDGQEIPPEHGAFDPNARLNRDNIHG